MLLKAACLRALLLAKNKFLLGTKPYFQYSEKEEKGASLEGDEQAVNLCRSYYVIKSRFLLGNNQSSQCSPKQSQKEAESI